MGNDGGRDRSRDLRTEIAQAAARILAEEGPVSFHAAKVKAAARLGIADGRHMPSNRDVHVALGEYQRLFIGEEHAELITRLRRLAVEAMRFLAAFDPRLAGPVLSGTASEHTPVNIHVFSDDPEAIAHTLIEHGIPYDLGERRFRAGRDALAVHPTYAFLSGDTPIEITVFPEKGVRQAPPSAIDGRPMPRADLATVLDLLERGLWPDEGSPNPG